MYLTTVWSDISSCCRHTGYLDHRSGHIADSQIPNGRSLVWADFKKWTQTPPPTEALTKKSEQLSSTSLRAYTSCLIFSYVIHLRRSEEAELITQSMSRL